MKFASLALMFSFALLAPLRSLAKPAIILQATRNTRDLGGLPVKGGQLRPGRLFRSGALCFVTRADVDRLNELHCTTVVDLRTAREIAKDGLDRPGLEIPRKLALPMHNSYGRGQQAYHSYIREGDSVVRSFFEMLGRSESYPVLFHCSAGKDRTGILAALVLWSLGAEREVILDDYLQSQRNAAGLIVKPEWIGEVFQYVDECGGIEAYLSKVGVSTETVERLREELVEPSSEGPAT